VARQAVDAPREKIAGDDQQARDDTTVRDADQLPPERSVGGERTEPGEKRCDAGQRHQ
jgi:hypothetical protein